MRAEVSRQINDHERVLYIFDLDMQKEEIKLDRVERQELLPVTKHWQKFAAAGTKEISDDIIAEARQILAEKVMNAPLTGAK